VRGIARCFGCGDENAAGLRLHFSAEEDGVVSRVLLGPEFESHPGIVHGGIVATVLDEVMGQAARLGRERPVLTIGLKIRYIEPMRSGRAYTARGLTLSDDGGHMKLRGELWDEELIAVAEGTFRIV
jgi:acyl-coenzyme A thioesterase PaaI-like protein